MCGIVGYIGKRNVLPILIDGLKKLEYRGYDSAGIAYFNDNNIKIIKSIGRINDLEDKLNFDYILGVIIKRIDNLYIEIKLLVVKI